MAERGPPANLLAERGLLGAILVNNKTVDRCAGLSGEDFYWPAHGLLFEAMRSRIEQGRSVDPIVMQSFADVVFEGESGVVYLMKLASMVIGTLMIKEYAQSIMDCALRRRIIEVAETMIAEAHGTEPGLVTSTAAVAAIEQATNRYAVAGTTSIGRAVAVAVAQASARQRGEKTGHYLMTGCKPLDNIWRGLHNGALEILGGRAGSGKTALARQIARHVAAKGAAVAFFSLEMPHADLATADLSSVSGVSMDTIRLGEFDNRQAEAILRAEKYLAQLPIHIVDTPGLPIDQAVSRMRAMVRTVGAKLVIVDHRDQFGRDSKDRDDIGWYRNITQVLKVTAKSLNIPILLLVQLSRDIERRENKTPRMSDLMYSGEADADTIILMHREGDVATASFVKRRFGALGNVRLHFAEVSTTFGSWT